MNPPGYRKDGDERPRSTVTFKEDGFKHDPKHNQIRLSKGTNLKDGRSEFILWEYETRPGVDLSDVKTVQNVRAVWTGDEWDLHSVCKDEIKVDVQDESPDGKAGIDLGITNIVTIAFPDTVGCDSMEIFDTPGWRIPPRTYSRQYEEYVLYPGNTVKQDKHYFTPEGYETEGENGPPEASERARRKLTARETHVYHALTTTIIEECVERGVGTLAVSWPEDVRAKDWGKTGSKKLHSWAFDRLYQYLNYNGEEYDVEVVKENKWDTSKTCSNCGDETKSNRVERGLYVCSSCDLVGNADCNRAENMRQRITPSSHGEDRSNGCVAQPPVHLFDRESGTFTPRDQAGSWTSKYPTARDGKPRRRRAKPGCLRDLRSLSVHGAEDVT